RAEDSGEVAATVHGAPPPGDQHGPRGVGPPRPGAPTAPAAVRGQGHGAVPANRAECAVVCRLQRRIHARNRRYCYPLTVTDFASRYLLTCEALATTQEQY